MGIISLERIDNLIWLGRYSERIYLTIKEFFFYYDKMLDDPNLYKEYCYILQILMIYENPKDFIDRYVCDPTISDSLLSNLFRAYDNCIVLRNEIGTESMTYLEMALYQLQEIKNSDSLLLDLQLVMDHILAFWACISENVFDYDVRNIIKLGQRQERLDMYLRLKKEKEKIKMAFESLEHRLYKTILPYNIEYLDILKEEIKKEEMDHQVCIRCTEGLL